MDNFADLSGTIIRNTGEIGGLTENSSKVVYILVVSLQTVRPITRAATVYRVLCHHDFIRTICFGRAATHWCLEPCWNLQLSLTELQVCQLGV